MLVVLPEMLTLISDINTAVYIGIDYTNTSCSETGFIL